MPSENKPGKVTIDIQKRNSFILEMKELFGNKDMYEYISFFNQHAELPKETIIELYIKKITSQ